MKKKIVILAAGMLLFLMSGIFFLQPGVAKAENDPEDLGGYMTAAENGRSVIFNLIDSDNQIAESYNIRAVVAESGVPGTDPHMSVKFNVSSTARTNSSHFNFSVVPGTYGTKLDQHGMYTILDLTCTMRVPPYLRQAGIGDNSIPSVFKEDKTDGYQTYIDNYPYGRFGAYSYDPRGCVGFASFQLPRTPDGAERGSYTFKLQINIGNFRMNERTVGNVVAKKTYQFRYNKVAFLFNVANASVGSGHGFSSQNGYLNFDLLGGGQLLVVPFNGNPATFEQAAGYDVHKPGYRFHCWESTVNNAASGGGQSFAANTPYILELFRDHANPNGCSVVNVDSSNPGQGWVGMNPNYTILQELKPIWDLIGYKITYNLQGGTNPNNPDDYTVETPTFTLKNPTRAGYEFTGWTGSNGTTKNKNVTVRKGTTGDLTFTANWNRLLEFYNLTFDLQGGKANNKWLFGLVAEDVQENAAWNTDKSGVVKEKLDLEKPPIKEGYAFTGWYFEDGTKFTGNEKATADTTVYAHWKLVEYPITYDLQGGTDPENPDKYTIETPTFTLKNPTRRGYDFIGWTGSNGSIPATEVKITKGSTGKKEYTAQWKPIEYPIIYDLQGGDDPENPEKYTIETPTFTLKKPTKKGYEFTGWTGSNGDTPETEVTIAQGSIGNREYTAHWKAIDYNIRYNLQGGTDPENPEKYTIETPDFTLKNPTKSGYEFIGWTGSNGDTPETAVMIKQGSTGDREYTAHWRAIEYPITYHLKGGTDPHNPDRYTIETPDILLKNPEKSGYAFLGWTGSNGSTPDTGVVIAKGSTGAKEYTANWTAVDYKINYDLQGGTDPHNPSGYNTETPDFTLKNPTRKGYEFTGWTGSNGETPETKVTIKQGSTGDKKFTANWKPAAYKITYDLDGGKDPKNPTKYTVETPTFTLKNPTRKGYIFRGWKGTGLKEQSKKVTVKKGSTGNRHYRAVWEPKISKLPYLKTTKLINKGSKFRFIVYGENKKGYRKVWNNTNKKVLSLNKKGVAKAKKNGTAVVGYKLYDKKNQLVYGFQIKVRVITTEFETLNTSKKISTKNPTFMFDKTLCIGKKFKLGFRNLEKGAKVTYVSSNPKVLSVSKSGVAKSKKKGFAYVTITLKQQNLTYRYRVHFKCEKIEF